MALSSGGRRLKQEKNYPDYLSAHQGLLEIGEFEHAALGKLPRAFKPVKDLFDTHVRGADPSGIHIFCPLNNMGDYADVLGGAMEVLAPGARVTPLATAPSHDIKDHGDTLEKNIAKSIRNQDQRFIVFDVHDLGDTYNGIAAALEKVRAGSTKDTHLFMFEGDPDHLLSGLFREKSLDGSFSAGGGDLLNLEVLVHSGKSSHQMYGGATTVGEHLLSHPIKYFKPEELRVMDSDPAGLGRGGIYKFLSENPATLGRIRRTLDKDHALKRRALHNLGVALAHDIQSLEKLHEYPADTPSLQQLARKCLGAEDGRPLLYRSIFPKDVIMVLRDGTDITGFGTIMMSPFEQATMRHHKLDPIRDADQMIRVIGLDTIDTYRRPKAFAVYDRGKLDLLYFNDTFFARFTDPGKKQEALLGVFVEK